MAKKIGLCLMVLLYAGIGVAVSYLVSISGIYPAGSDTMFYVYRGDFLYRSIRDSGNWYPLLDLAEQLSFSVLHTHDIGKMTVDLVFLVLIRLLTAGETKERNQARPLSPALRAELSKLEQHQASYRLLTERNIHSVEELSAFIVETETAIHTLEQQRQTCRNHLRRKKPPEETAAYQKQISLITQALAVRRKDLRTASRTLENISHMYELLETERQMEHDAMKQERSYAR